MMKSFFNKFKKENKNASSAVQAKERLQIIIASSNSKKLFFMPELEREVFKLIKKYMDIKEGDIVTKVDIDAETGCKVLELNVNFGDCK